MPHTMNRKVRRIFGLKSERGAALVEFALVVPFLVMIMCATIDFGLAVYVLNNLTAAVREGSRYAATRIPPPAANDTFVTGRVYRYIVNLPSNQTAAQKRATITSTAANAAGDITVSITGFEFKPMTPLASWMGLGNIYMNRSATFRSETAPD